jgi:hypothetical protein
VTLQYWAVPSDQKAPERVWGPGRAALAQKTAPEQARGPGQLPGQAVLPEQERGQAPAE